MKFQKKDFNSEYYRLWEMGLLIPEPKINSIYNVKFTFEGQNSEHYDRVCLKASSPSDALERACYSSTHTSGYRPEDVILHSVYDEEDNLLWVDEPYYNLIQKKHEFQGMERREFLTKFSATAAAILYGLNPMRANAGTTKITFNGIVTGILPTASGACPGATHISGSSIYTAAAPSGGGGGGGGKGVHGGGAGNGGGGGGASLYGGTGGAGGADGGGFSGGAGGAGNALAPAGGSGGNGGAFSGDYNVAPAGNGGLYGGGKGSGPGGGGTDGSGALRIIWGSGRSFPSNAT